MQQEYADAFKQLSPFKPGSFSTFQEKVKEIKGRWEAPPPQAEDFVDETTQKALRMARQRLGGSRRGSFVTGQAADSSYLTNPKTLLGGK